MQQLYDDIRGEIQGSETVQRRGSEGQRRGSELRFRGAVQGEAYKSRTMIVHGTCTATVQTTVGIAVDVAVDAAIDVAVDAAVGNGAAIGGTTVVLVRMAVRTSI